MTGRQILESHPKGMAYAELLANHKRYPVLVDGKNQVLSMPPIINSEETKLKQGTTRVFIDVTGISQAAVTKSLDTLVCSLAEIGGKIETVTIKDADGKQRTTPDLDPAHQRNRRRRSQTLARPAARRQSLTAALRKMRFDVTVSRSESSPSESKLQALSPQSPRSSLPLPRLPHRHPPHGRPLRRRRHRLRLRQHRAATRPLDDRRHAAARRSHSATASARSSSAWASAKS